MQRASGPTWLRAMSGPFLTSPRRRRLARHHCPCAMGHALTLCGGAASVAPPASAPARQPAYYPAGRVRIKISLATSFGLSRTFRDNDARLSTSGHHWSPRLVLACTTRPEKRRKHGQGVDHHGKCGRASFEPVEGADRRLSLSHLRGRVLDRYFAPPDGEGLIKARIGDCWA